MRSLLAFTAAAVLATAAAASAALPPAPVAKRIPVSDTYWGMSVVDPYRWMESNGADLQAYLKAQNDRTRRILDAIPGRAQLLARLTQLADTANWSSDVVQRKGAFFYEKIPSGADAPRLYVRSGVGGAERLLVDPDAIPGVHQTIAWFLPNDDGTLVAVGLAAGGSENATARVVDVGRGTFLPDTIARARFGATAWSADGKAFYYSRLQQLPPGAPPTAAYANVTSYRHVVGQSGDADAAVFGALAKNPAIQAQPTEFAFLGLSPETPFAAGILVNGVSPFNTVFVAPASTLANPATTPWKRIVRPEDKIKTAALHGTTIYAVSAQNAPRYKLIAFPVSGGLAQAKDVIPAGTRVVDDVATASDAAYVTERENGLGRVVRVGYDGSVRDVPLPVNGTVSGLSTEYNRPGFVVQLTSWTQSPLWYRYDPATNRLVDTRIDARSPVDYSAVTSEEVTVPAADGVAIPLSIVHRRDMKLDGSNPTLLYAYGSYGISSDPGFSASRMALLERGAIFAVAHVRGGGELGEEWHVAGKGANKVNTVTDFIACAQWLVDRKYTSPAKLGARGGSAGGITMGGAITRAPRLFAAVLDEVPVSDQLRIETTPNGPPNIPEFGSVKTEQGFKDLYATSAVQHVAKGTPYPAVLLTTGANDPRVDPWQAAKMAATLQADTSSDNPILLRVDFEGGHGIFNARSQTVALTADEDAFLFWRFGMPGFQPAL